MEPKGKYVEYKYKHKYIRSSQISLNHSLQIDAFQKLAQNFHFFSEILL